MSDWTDKHRYDNGLGYADESISDVPNKICNRYTIHATGRGYRIFDMYHGEYIASEIPRLDIAIIISRFFESM